MTLGEFRKAGNPATLLSAFLYFDISFMIWTVLGPLGPFLGEAMHLTATQKGLMVAIPSLAGSFFRPILGALYERFGGRPIGLMGIALTFIPLLLGWKFASGLSHVMLLGGFLGIAGASFAVALPMVGRWYPPKYQGLAMGIAGAGNSGTVFATLFAPRIAQAFGWHTVFALMTIPLALVFGLFFAFAKDAPNRPKAQGWSAYSSVLSQSDSLWFCFLYSITFGGFLGINSFLPTFFHDQYGLSKVTAGDFVTIAVIAGSFLRPVGGSIADRIGGYRLLLVLLTGVALCMGVVATLPSAYVALAVIAVMMGMLGMGNGSVFQMMPHRFPQSMGIMTGIVGAAGGLGGFFLPSLLGYTKDRFGNFTVGFALLAGLVISAAALLLLRGVIWKLRWSAESVERTGVFSIRESEAVLEKVA